MSKKIFTLSADDANRRLDRVLRKFLCTVPLPVIYRALRKGLIRINGKRVQASCKTCEGDVLAIASSLIESEGSAAVQAGKSKKTKQTAQNTEQRKTATVHTAKPFSILLQTLDILVVNKPAGIPVHGEHSLTQQILHNGAAAPIRQQQALSFTIGPLHRLDKYTSGCICFSQSLHGAQWFSEHLRNQHIVKYYLGIVEGKPTHGIIQTAGDMGDALTYYTAAAYNAAENCSLILFHPVTGRKHQIRKHAQHIGHPLVGDSRYGSTRRLPAFPAYCLHAWRLILPYSRPAGVPELLEAPLFSPAARLVNSLFPDWNNQIVNIINDTQLQHGDY